ncbi:unnamed protein product [Discosporangium mesarthrocarpum]
MGSIGGLLPVKLQTVNAKAVSCLGIAAAGVFFASAMVHMLPESSRTLEEWGEDIPWGGLLCSFGFFLVLIIEQTVELCLDSGANSRRHHLFPTEAHSSERGDGLGDCLDMSSGMGSNPQGGEGAEEDDAGLLSSGNFNEEVEGIMNQWGPNMGGGWGWRRGEVGAGLGPGERGHHNFDHHVRGHSWEYERVQQGEGGHVHPGHVDLHELGGKDAGVLTRVLMMAALSVHAVLEGLALGARPTKGFNILFAIALHKGLAAYALGASLLRTGVTMGGLTGYVVFFSAMTPVGIAVGAWLGGDGEGTTAAACVAVASGTFLYIALMEVLPRELGVPGHGCWKLGSLLLGFTMSAWAGLMVG